MAHSSRIHFLGAAAALFLVSSIDSRAEAAPGRRGDDRVTVFSDNTIAADESIDGNAVAVLGDLTVNGTVHGDAVAVMGDLTLGPDARVDGDVVCVGGKSQVSPDAKVDGRIVRRGFGAPLYFLPSLRAFSLDGFRSRPVWFFDLAILALYALVALLFPGGIRRCGAMLVEHPGLSIISAVLTLVVLPFLFVLLLVSIIGIPVAIIALPMGLAGFMMFGKASFYALVGRAISRDGLPPAAAVLVGGLLCLLFFLIPLVGMVLSFLVSVLMLGCAVALLFGLGKKPEAPSGSPGQTAAATPPASVGAHQPADEAMKAEASATPREDALAPPLTEPAAPPPLQANPPRIAEPLSSDAATLTRAGFWIRLLALLIDLLLVSAVFHVFGPFCLILLAAYGAIMWNFKGTTVGGIICGLRVIRLDGRPIDWSTAIARAAGCFVSMIFFNLGFIWVAFDDQHQSWHDKIAGTTVVYAPKGTSLV